MPGSQLREAAQERGMDGLPVPGMLWFKASVPFGLLSMYIATTDGRECDLCPNICFLREWLDLLSVRCFFNNIGNDLDVLKMIGLAGKQNSCNIQSTY